MYGGREYIYIYLIGNTYLCTYPGWQKKKNKFIFKVVLNNVLTRVANKHKLMTDLTGKINDFFKLLNTIYDYTLSFFRPPYKQHSRETISKVFYFASCKRVCSKHFMNRIFRSL